MGATTILILDPARIRHTAKLLRMFADRYEAVAKEMESAGVAKMEVPNGPSLEQGTTRIRVHVTGLERVWDDSQIGLSQPSIDELSTADTESSITNPTDISPLGPETPVETRPRKSARRK